MAGGHIQLDGEWYTIDLRSRKKKDIIDFSPRTAEAGNPVHSELQLYQTLNFESWQGGFGAPWHTATKTNMYMYTVGQIDTRHPGIAMLYTSPSTSSTDYAVDGFLGFGGDIYTYCSTGIEKYTSSDGTWGNVDTDGSVGLWQNGYYIFSCRIDDTLIYGGTDVGASTDWTETGATTDQVSFSWLQHHDGYVYGGQFAGTDGSSGHFVSYDDSLDLSDIYTVSSDDTQIIPIGLNGYETKKGVSYRTDLYIPRPDGLYKMDKDRTAARRVLNYSDVSSSDNFRSVVEYNGQLIYPIRSTLKQWNGVREVPMNPPFLTDTWPYQTYGRFDNFVVVGRFLFMTARTNDATYEEHILCFDNVAWHKMETVVINGSDTIKAMHFDPANDRLWYSIRHATGADDIRYIPFQENSDFPYEDFPVAGEHAIVFPRIAAGFKEVYKSTPSCLIAGSNCDTGQYLELYYTLGPSTTWLPWGADSGVSNVLTSDGTKKFIEPLGEDKSTVEYEYINFKIDFVSSNSTGTPVLEGFYPRVLIRPDTLWGWSFSVKASANVQYGTAQSNKTVKEILDELKAVRDSKAPVPFKDIYNDEYQVYITSVTESSIEEHVDRPGPDPDIEAQVMLNLVQVG